MKFFFIALLFLGSSSVSAQTRLETSAEPSTITVGDPIAFFISLRSSAPFTLQNDFEKQPLGAFEVLSVKTDSPSFKDGLWRQSVNYHVTLFETGVSTLPAVALIYSLADGSTHTLSTPEIPINVTSVLGPESRDIRGIKIIGRPWWKRAWVWGVMVFFLTALASFIYWRRRRGRPFLPSFELPPRPAADVARESLSVARGLLEADPKDFYTCLSLTVRAYLEGRFQLLALERTTAELIKSLKEKDWAKDHFWDLRETLEASDLAKFAKARSTLEERVLHLEKMSRFVEATAPLVCEGNTP